MATADLSRVRLDDSAPLSAEDERRIAQICDILNVVLAERPAYVAARGLPPDVAQPNGLKWGTVGEWGGSYRSLRQKDMVIAALFRAVGNNFNDRPVVIYHDPELAPRPDRFVDRWQRMASVLPCRWHVRLPPRFGEVGWWIAGGVVNVQAAFYQEAVTLLHMAGILGFAERMASRGTLRVLEIGGGFGPMPLTFIRAAPVKSWWACDLPESLFHQAVYLSTLLPERRHVVYTGALPLGPGFNSSLTVGDAGLAASLENAVVYVPNFLLSDFVGHLEVDLALNFESFSEMAAAQVHDYGAIIGQMIGRAGILFEQNGDHRDKPGGNLCKEHLMPYFPFRLPSTEILPAFATRAVYRGQPDVWTNVPPHELGLPPSQAERERIATALLEPGNAFDLNFLDPRVGTILGDWLSSGRG